MRRANEILKYEHKMIKRPWGLAVGMAERAREPSQDRLVVSGHRPQPALTADPDPALSQYSQRRARPLVRGRYGV